VKISLYPPNELEDFGVDVGGVGSMMVGIGGMINDS
jgi:hypothetical protein